MKNLIPFAVAASLGCAAAPAPKTAPAAVPQVLAGAVWTPPADFRDAFHAACDGGEGQDIGACFLRAMEKAGAPAAAVDFARRTGDQGYLTQLRESGVVDVAYAEYPFRANENRVVLLVNGEPAAIDVDDPSLISTKIFQGNSVYAALSRSTSNIAVFPGDRSSLRFPRVLARAGGGQSYVVPYELTDGCHACKVLGDAYVGFDFDARGRFERLSILRVQARYH